jgi:competence protein ComEC
VRYILFHRYKVLCATLACVAFVVCFIYVRTEQGVLRVFFLDVGQGDAIYIRTPSGRDMLIDGGPGRIVLQRLSEVMPWYDKSMDVVLETHPDADHIGGLPEVLSRYHVGLFVEPGVDSPNTIDDEIIRIRKEKNIEHVFVRRGMRIDFGDGAHFDVLYPDVDPSHLETNEASIVGRLVYGSTSVMFTGDSPKVVENHLIEIDGGRLRSNILKAGHHGSRSSSGETYVKTVAPAVAIISSGKNNRYGHPHKEVVDIFNKLGVQILRTDKVGTISFVSDGQRIFQQ